MTLKIGDEVISKDDPGRRGQIVKGPRNRSDGTVYLIRWNDGTSGWTPDYAIEHSGGVDNDVFSLLGKGSFGRLNDLRRNLTYIHLSGRLANLVYSEAHYLRNPETQSAVIGRLLREVSEHIVLLSATPINNRSSDLYQLLQLVDPDSFYTNQRFPEVLAANEPLVRARNLALDTNSTGEQIQKQLEAAREHPIMEHNYQLQGLLNEEISIEFLSETANRIELANRIERINLLVHTVNRTRKVEVQEWKVVREAVSYFVDLNKESSEWQFYTDVTNAVRQYALLNEISDGFLLSPPQRQMSSCMYAAARSWADKSTLDLADLEQRSS